MRTSTVLRFLTVALVACGVAAPGAIAQQATRFSPVALAKNGDSVGYGLYRIIRLGDGIYQIKDPGDPKAKAGGLIGVDMYLVRGASKALLIDLGNNYIDGYPGDVIPPRPHAAEELRAVVDGLRGRLPFEVAITHAHPDHDGMTRAFIDRKVKIRMPKGEDLEAPRKQHGNIDPSVYTVFDHATKTFDLGGGRVVKPLLVRGHSNGCTAYLLAKDLILFTGDSIGIGAGRSLRSAESLKLFAEDTQKLVEYSESQPGTVRAIRAEGLYRPQRREHDRGVLQRESPDARSRLPGLALRPGPGVMRERRSQGHVAGSRQRPSADGSHQQAERPSGQRHAVWHRRRRNPARGRGTKRPV